MKRLSVLLAVLTIILSGCAGTGDGSGEGAFPRGWSEVATAPFEEGFRDFVAFWADDRLIVTGGYTANGQEVTFSSATYVFDLEENRWTEGEPLVLDGFDGTYGGSGIWTGSHWVGQMSGCRSGPLVGDDPINNCQLESILVSWSPADGWASAPMPRGAVDRDHPLTFDAGQLGSEVVVATQFGAVFVSPPAIGDARFVPWPSDAVPYVPDAACTVGDTLLVLSSSLGPLDQQDVNVRLPQQVIAHSFGADGRERGRFSVVDLPTPPIFPFCQRDVGLYLDGQSFGGVPLRLVEPGGVRTLDRAPTTGNGDLTQPVAGVTSSWLDVGDGILSLDSLGLSCFFLDRADGTTVPLQPVPRLTRPQVWTGQVILAHLAESPRWFVLVPGPWQSAGELPPPTVD